MRDPGNEVETYLVASILRFNFEIKTVSQKNYLLFRLQGKMAQFRMFKFICEVKTFSLSMAWFDAYVNHWLEVIPTAKHLAFLWLGSMYTSNTGLQ